MRIEESQLRRSKEGRRSIKRKMMKRKKRRKS
jgi:hypothetical protein